MGNVRLYNTTLSSALWQHINCDLTGAPIIAQLSPNAAVNCTASHTFNQTSFEASSDDHTLNTTIEAVSFASNKTLSYDVAQVVEDVPISTSYTATMSLKFVSCDSPSARKLHPAGTDTWQQTQQICGSPCLPVAGTLVMSFSSCR